MTLENLKYPDYFILSNYTIVRNNRGFSGTIQLIANNFFRYFFRKLTFLVLFNLAWDTKNKFFNIKSKIAVY